MTNRPPNEFVDPNRGRWETSEFHNARSAIQKLLITDATVWTDDHTAALVENVGIIMSRIGSVHPLAIRMKDEVMQQWGEVKDYGPSAVVGAELNIAEWAHVFDVLGLRVDARMMGK